MLSFSRLRSVRVTTILLASLIVLSGCGFRLQGSFTLPEVMSVTYLQTGNEYSEFYRAMKRRLIQSGARVTRDRSEATATLVIGGDSTGQRVLSVSSSNVPQEYEVFYSLEYSVRAHGQELLAPKEITLTRNYTYDETDVLGKAQEEQVLRSSLVDDLVRLVSLRLAAL